MPHSIRERLRGRGLWGAARDALALLKRRSSGVTNPYLPPAPELQRQRDEDTAGWPAVSFVLREAGSGEELRRFIKSLGWQTYRNWQLVVQTGEALPSGDPRIVAVTENPEQAATGGIIAFAAPGSMLAPHAAYHLARAAVESGAGLFYADDAPYTGDFYTPGPARYKPGWSREYYLGYEYIGGLVALRRPLLDTLGAQKSLPALVLGAAGAGEIHRIPHVLSLYIGQPEVAEHRAAVEEYLAAAYPGARLEAGPVPGTNRVVYPLAGEPLVSVIIPSSDHLDDLRRCLESLHEKTAYRNYEVIVVENHSQEGKTFAYYDSAKRQYGIEVAQWREPGFNFAKLCNFGRGVAKGEYLLFLNNDTEVIAPGWMEEMLRWCTRPCVGCVGALLRYGDGSVQHAGCVTVPPGFSMHAGRGVPYPGYMNRTATAQEYNAVTGACLMVSAGDFDAAGGFDENLAVTFNDIQLCLALRAQGRVNIYTPFAELYHHEGQSRGEDIPGEKRERALREMWYMRWLWGTRWDDDTYYNPSLAQDREDYSTGNPMDSRVLENKRREAGA